MNRIKASLRIAASIIFILGVWQPTKGDSSTLLLMSFQVKKSLLQKIIFTIMNQQVIH